MTSCGVAAVLIDAIDMGPAIPKQTNQKGDHANLTHPEMEADGAARRAEQEMPNTHDGMIP